MKAAVLLAPQQMHIEDRPVPQPGAGEVRLRVTLAGVCTTDVHIFHGHFPVPLPRVLGHELAGVVEAAGAGVDPAWVGQSVGVSPARFCGKCSACRRGLPELCERFECLGNTHDGGFSEYALVRADQLSPLDGMPAEKAVWLEPLGCVLHALDAAHAAEAETLLVLGAGVYGKLTLLAARAVSQARTAVIDPNPDKVAQARELEAQSGWTAPRQGPAPELDAQVKSWAPEGVQAVIDTSGVPLALERAVRWTAPGARLVLFGVPAPGTQLSLDSTALFSRQLVITAAAGMTPDSFTHAFDLLKSGQIDPSRLASEMISIEDLPALLAAPDKMRIAKVFIKPGVSR
jgi:D-arabinitol dehydrogenase (NADP+)